MDIEIHSSSGLSCVIKSNRERIEKLEEMLKNIEVKESDDHDKGELQYLDQLIDKLTDISDQSSLLGAELESMRKMDEDEEDEESDNMSMCTEATDIAQDLIDQNPDFVGSGPCTDCKACMKNKSKQIRKDKKAKEKQRRAELKEFKKKQRNILLDEQTELKLKLDSFRNQIDRMADDTFQIINTRL